MLARGLAVTIMTDRFARCATGIASFNTPMGLFHAHIATARGSSQNLWSSIQSWSTPGVLRLRLRLRVGVIIMCVRDRVHTIRRFVMSRLRLAVAGPIGPCVPRHVQPHVPHVPQAVQVGRVVDMPVADRQASCVSLCCRAFKVRQVGASKVRQL